MNTESQYYVQYHNADNIQQYPNSGLDFNLKIENIELNNQTLTQKLDLHKKKKCFKS